MGNIADIYGLSNTQKGILFHTVYEQEVDLYHNQLLFQAVGNIDEVIFKQAWEAVVQRHDVLKSSFHWENLEKPMQVVHSQASLDWTTHNWEHFTEQEQEVKLSAFIKADKQTKFELDKPCLMRVNLFKTSPTAYKVLWSFHHLILDGWCLPILLKEVLENFKSIFHRLPINRPQGTPYKQYVLWQKQQHKESAKSYWQNELKAITGATAIRQYGTSRTAKGASYADEILGLGEAVSAGLNLFVKHNNITPNTFFQGAWALLMSRYTAEKAVIMGETVSGRNFTLEGAEHAIGLFINTLPVSLTIQEQIPVVEWLAANQLKRFEREQQSFLSLTEIHQVSSIASVEPLFESLFVFENYPVDALRLEDKDGITLSGFKSYEQTNYPLTIVVLPGKEIKLQLSYDENLYLPGWIKQLLAHYQQLLLNIAASPTCKVGGISMITAEETELLNHWNNTVEPLPDYATFLHLWESNAMRYKHNIALVAGSQRATYAELNALSNRIAQFLLTRTTVLKGKGVIILLPRSIEFAACVLAAWKCGAYYIPVDAAYPIQRVNTIINDSGASLVLANSGPVADSLALAYPGLLVEIDSSFSIIDTMPDNDQLIPIDRDGLSYVIYTSGSTGKPKGAMVEHLGMLNHLFAKVNALQLNEQSIIVQNASQCFDISVWQLFAALAAGGTSLIYPDDLVVAPEEFIAQVDKDKATILEVVPSYLGLLLSGIEPPRATQLFSSLHYLLVTGEVVSKPLVNQWLILFPGIPIVNAYGPTEASDDITHCLIRQLPEWPEIPIGKAIQNVSIYIVDRNFNRCPPGIKGEICVAGISVGRGYLNDATQTAKSFLTNPFVDHEERLYKTGDIGMYLADGSIVFSGRKDYQVKVRGHRIELGEIEAGIYTLQGIEAVVVKDFKTAEGEVYLCAFINAVNRIDDQTIKLLLGKHLPAYMVPAYFVWLDQLPLNANGKIEREKLVMPAHLLNKDLYSTAETNVTPAEDIIISIWKGVLNKRDLNPEDNFFEIGGHSLKAMQVASMVKEAFGINLPIRAIFENPTPRLLCQYLSSARSSNVPLNPMEPQTGALFPLSFAQERLWYIQQMQPFSAVYNMTGFIVLEGDLEESCLQKSIENVLGRHKTLTAIIESHEGIPKLRYPVFGGFKLKITAIDEASLPGVMEQAASQPFDLEKGLLFRAELFRLEKHKHVLFLGMHHIAGDGLSIPIQLREIASYYNGMKQQLEPTVTDLQLQYHDYAVWQRKNLEEGLYNEQFTYWDKQLAGVESELDLPFDRPRPEVQSFVGATHRFKIDQHLCAAIQKFNSANNVSAYITLLSCYAALLYRYTNQKDIMIGSPVANRSAKEVEGLIGFFVNTLGLRVKPDQTISFKELCKQVRSTCLDAFDHQDIPFEQVVDKLNIPRRMNVNPLFQVVFVMQHGNEMPHFDGLVATGFESEVHTSKFDMTLMIKQRGEFFDAEIEYNTALFDQSKIENLATHFVTMLECSLTKPDASISKHQYLSRTEVHKVLNVWSGVVTDPISERLITDAFVEQVKALPNQPAIIDGMDVLTYKELHELSNKLANKLISFHVQPGDVVGIAMERSISSIVAMTAILKVGAIYLPLDTSYPEQRLNFMMKDAKVKVIIVAEFSGNSATDDSLRTINIHSITNESAELNYSQNINAYDGAYINFTSGSAGRPKGVLIPHIAVVRLVKDTNYISITKGQRVSHNSNISFDATTLEVWLPLLNGGTIVLLDKHSLLDFPKFGQLLLEQKVDVMFLTTSLFNQVANSYPESFGSLNYIVVGGEKALIATFDQVMSSKHPPKNLVNGYGPTENTTFSICYHYKTADLAGERVPLGIPISNSTAYLLDENLQPVPAGITGEIYLGGQGLAIGYLHNEELTVQKFLNVDLDDFRKERLYRTNDLGRYRVTGEIDYYGRNDKQLKVRGFRIEPGEIETAMLKFPGLKECYVLADSQERLIAFYICEGDSVINIAEIKMSLTDFLPSYMIPAAFIELNTFPLTPNGKMDIEKLQQIVDAPKVLTKVHEPLTSTKALLTGIWKQLLKLDKLEPDDNFFELGGHSLLITRMLAEVARATGVRLSIKAGFENPTVTMLANLIDAQDAKTGLKQIPPITKSTENENHFPLSFAQERLWFLNEYIPNAASYNIYAALNLNGYLNVEAMELSLNNILERHSILRTTFKIQDYQSRQVVHPFTPIKVKLIDVSLDDSDKVTTLLERDARHVFDMHQGPLWYIKLYRLSEDQHIMMFNMHHIIADGWSITVFAEELVHFYNAKLQNKANMLPELSFQYADFSRWQREQFNNGVFNYQLEYWQSQLANCVDVDYVQTDHLRKPAGEVSGKSITVPSLFEHKIQDQAIAFETTTFVYLMSSFQLYLYFVSGENDVLTGTNIANRNWEHTDKLIGFFVNQMVIRTIFNDVETFQSVLRKSHQNSLNAYDNQDVSFEMIVKELNVARVAGRNPLFQTKLVLQNTPVNTISLDGLAVSNIPLDNQTSKFDFVLLLEEQNGEISGSVEYNDALFETKTITNMIKEWEMLVNILHTHSRNNLNEIKVVFDESCRTLQKEEEELLKHQRTSRLKQIRRKEIDTNNN